MNKEWVLNIEGKLLNSSENPHISYYNNRKLSSFIKELQIIFDNQNY